jgi:uncharacterized membrane protein YoaK (UPF0700 family)
MGVISKETLALISLVRGDFPKTWEWVRHKANWEGMCVGAVCTYYDDHIKTLMEEEKNNV